MPHEGLPVTTKGDALHSLLDVDIERLALRGELPRQFLSSASCCAPRAMSAPMTTAATSQPSACPFCSGSNKRFAPPSPRREGCDGAEPTANYFAANSSSTQRGTSTPASPNRRSSKKILPWLGSRLISSVRAPRYFAVWTKPAAG